MENNFKIEIISPENIMFSEEIKSATLPAYEGEMCILKQHISIITFLRPGIIKVEKKDGSFEKFFVQDGTAEFSEENLIVLSASVINIKNLSKAFVDNLNKDTETKLAKKDLSDHDRYVLSHKLDTLKEIRT